MIINREQLEKDYINLGNLLEKLDYYKNLKNHCYWRIANDIACNQKWNLIVKKPFYKKASQHLLNKSVNILKYLIKHPDKISNFNKVSLNYRKLIN